MDQSISTMLNHVCSIQVHLCTSPPSALHIFYCLLYLLENMSEECGTVDIFLILFITKILVYAPHFMSLPVSVLIGGA